MISFGLFIVVMGSYIISQNESRVTQAAVLSSNGLASFVSDYVEKHQLLIKSIAYHNQDRILQLSKGAGYPYDLDEIHDDIKELFPDGTEFAIVNQNGRIVVGSDVGHMGERCQSLITQTMRGLSSTVSKVKAHQTPQGEFHFDVLFPIVVGEERAGFWVKLSFSPLEKFIVNLNIKDYDLVVTEQVPPYRVLLGKTSDNRRAEPVDFIYMANQQDGTNSLKTVLAVAPITNVAWQVRAIHNDEVHKAYVNNVFMIAITVFLSVFIVVSIVYFFVRGLQEEKEKIRQDAVHDEMFNAGPTVLLEKQTDMKMQVLYASPNVEPLLGVSSKKTLDKSYLNWIYPDDVPMVRETLLKAYRDEKSTVEMVYRLKTSENGGFVWIYDLSHILYSSNGKPNILRGYITSVHAQKIAEKNATDLIQSVPEAIFVLDLDGNIINSNRAAEVLLGCDRTNLMNSLFSHWLEADSFPLYECMKHKYLTEQQSPKEESSRVDSLYLRNSQGTRVSVEIGFNRIELKGEPLLVQVVRDVTLQMQTQEQLSLAKEQAVALAKARSRFVATISHEIRTPMNGVLGMTDLLFDTQLNNIQTQYLQAIKQSGDVLLNIINEVLDFARLDEGQVTLVNADLNLKDILEETLHLLSNMAEEKGLKLTYDDTHLQSENYLGDAMRIQQLIFNLVGNALKFTEKGQIIIKLSNVLAEDGNQLVLIEVVDSGIGVAQENLSKLFESFTQADDSTSRQFGGTGLGLAICKQLADLMQGTIGVESELGKGSTFWVKLPLRKVVKTGEIEGGVESVSGPVLADKNLPLAGKTILLIEDNVINQHVIEGFLLRLGAKVDVAENGLKGVDFWRLGGLKYQLVLMDCQMPVMDGFEATKIIRKEEKVSARTQTIPIVALTANVMSEDKDKCLQAGMNDFLSKPIEKESFEAMVLKWVV
ncbi:PAS domain-containing hybrid sensor histidine kinase/response regulator [Thiomicrorhabdus lithotrophica]|uniref:histidine kinase n=1 Tax=Thiomicrorhabdus lithotrophica TaxID=2949997 RepID=A0ABY8CAH6_9GAMM|nr:ATP-binding protein [Thiomicrorhabdus lithotrophica]WEJ62929.1 ATP-binding protein [Thiomicrorhabdus lithotrophica]